MRSEHPNKPEKTKTKQKKPHIPTKVIKIKLSWKNLAKPMKPEAFPSVYAVSQKPLSQQRASGPGTVHIALLRFYTFVPFPLVQASLPGS